MYSFNYSTRFKKDHKRCMRRGYNMSLFYVIMPLLEESGNVSGNYSPHKLSGIFEGYWECHIKPDWLLIWKINETDKTIDLVRTGSHSDIFG